MQSRVAILFAVYVVISLFAGCNPRVISPTPTTDLSISWEKTTVPTSTSTATVSPTQTETLTPSVTPTEAFTPTSTLVPFALDLMEEADYWTLSSCDEQCGEENGKSLITNLHLVPNRHGTANSALQVSYDVKKHGWVLLTRGINPDRLQGTTGIRFFYKGSGAPNTVEFKMLLRYPGDTEDTTFGKVWNFTTDTDDNWLPLEAGYGQDVKCWWPADLCKKHGDIPDLAVVHHLEFGISNQLGDTPGVGWATFDDLIGIQP